MRRLRGGRSGRMTGPWRAACSSVRAGTSEVPAPANTSGMASRKLISAATFGSPPRAKFRSSRRRVDVAGGVTISGIAASACAVRASADEPGGETATICWRSVPFELTWPAVEGVVRAAASGSNKPFLTRPAEHLDRYSSTIRLRRTFKRLIIETTRARCQECRRFDPKGRGGVDASGIARASYHRHGLG